MIESYEIVIRLVLALVLGAFLGIERLHAGKMAGLRTFALISLGSAMFIVISEQIVARYGVDIAPLRVAASLVSGIGFLGAGMIIFQRDHIANLTTAAGVWVSAAIGSAVGFGLYLESIVVTFLVIFTFTAMWNLENRLKKKFRIKEDTEPDFKKRKIQ